MTEDTRTSVGGTRHFDRDFALARWALGGAVLVAACSGSLKPGGDPGTAGVGGDAGTTGSAGVSGDAGAAGTRPVGGDAGYGYSGTYGGDSGASGICSFPFNVPGCPPGNCAAGFSPLGSGSRNCPAGLSRVNWCQR